MLSMSTSSFGSWSIDELAVLVGLPTRTIRDYRTQGLIPPPRMEGRVGRYDTTHRSRLELIVRLQARGYSLAAIADLCAASSSGRSLEDVLGDSSAAGIDEPAVAYTTEQLVAAVPVFDSEALCDSAAAAGLLRRSQDRWVVRAPALLAVVADMVAAGANPSAVLRMVAGIVEGASRQAAAVGDLVETELWSGVGEPSLELVSTARRARLLLTQAVGSLFADAAGADLLRRASTPDRNPLHRRTSMRPLRSTSCSSQRCDNCADGQPLPAG